MSHFLLVEAIEDLFVPVLVHNNKKGEDEKILKRFEERAWNNPVVRYLDGDAKDLIEKKENIWSTQATAARMIAALQSNKSKVPAYLELIAKQPAKTETAIFAMHCYWEGEAHLGQLKGVVNTRSAWLQKKEVVEVEFDPKAVDYKTLIKQAQKMECASTIFSTSDRQQKVAAKLAKEKVVRVKDDEKTRVAKLSDQKYYLRNSEYRHLPLTLTQSTKINALLMKKDAEQTNILDVLNTSNQVRALLSPRQLKLAELVSLAKKINPGPLNAFVFPEDDAKLNEYYDELARAAQKVISRSKGND